MDDDERRLRIGQYIISKAPFQDRLSVPRAPYGDTVDLIPSPRLVAGYCNKIIEGFLGSIGAYNHLNESAIVAAASMITPISIFDFERNGIERLTRIIGPPMCAICGPSAFDWSDNCLWCERCSYYVDNPNRAAGCVRAAGSTVSKLIEPERGEFFVLLNGSYRDKPGNLCIGTFSISAALGVPIGTLKRWRHEGFGPSFIRSSYYRLDEWKAFIVGDEILKALSKRDRPKLLRARIAVLEEQAGLLNDKVKSINSLLRSKSAIQRHSGNEGISGPATGVGGEERDHKRRGKDKGRNRQGDDRHHQG